jgi:hypothetical protein
MHNFLISFWIAPNNKGGYYYPPCSIIYQSTNIFKLSQSKTPPLGGWGATYSPSTLRWPLS